MTDRRVRRLACLLSVLGIVAAVAADGQLNTSDLRLAGVCLTLIAGGWLMQRRREFPLAESFEQGHEDGFSKGFKAGQRAARPTVVGIDKRCCGSCKRSASRPTDVALRGTASTSGHNAAALAVAGPGVSVESHAWEANGGDGHDSQP